MVTNTVPSQPQPSSFPPPLLASALPDPGSKNTPSTSQNDADDGNTGCLTWCRSNFANYGHDCRAPARSHSGPCFTCGPRAPTSGGGRGGAVCGGGRGGRAGKRGGLTRRDWQTRMLCDGQCRDVCSDKSSCGRCGNRCPTGQICDDGVCGCSRGKTLCSDGSCRKNCPPACANCLCGLPVSVFSLRLSR